MDLLTTLATYYPEVQVTCIGDSNVYANFTAHGVIPLPSEAELQAHYLDDIKAAHIKALSQACQTEIRSGFVSQPLGYPAIYDSQEVDQLNLAGSFLFTLPDSDNPQGTTTYYAMRPVVDGVAQPKTYAVHNSANLKRVLMDGVTFKLGKLQRFNELRYVVLYQCATAAEVYAVTW